MRPALRFLPIGILACSGLAPLAQAANVFDSEALNSAIGERRDGEVYRAIDKLERMLADVPEAHRVKLELAVAYFQADIYDEAERLATEVQGVEDLPDAVRTNVDAFLALVQKRRQEAAITASKFTYELGFYAGHDDNVNFGIDDDVLGASTTSALGVGEKDDNFLGAKATVNHRYRFEGTKRVKDRPAVLTWESQAYYYRKNHNDEDDFDISVISFGTGPVLRVTNGTTYRARLRIDHIGQGTDTLGTFYSLLPEVTMPLGHGALRLDATLQARKYQDRASEGREGNRFGVGATYEIEVAEQMRVSAGLYGYTQSAEERTQDHHAEGYSVGWQWRPWTPFRIYAQYRYKDTEYQGTDVFIGDSRWTKEDRLIVGLQYAMDKWLFGLQVQNLDVESNGAVYEYDRTEWLATAARRFD